jgi:hypothetical protein
MIATDAAVVFLVCPAGFPVSFRAGDRRDDRSWRREDD